MVTIEPTGPILGATVKGVDLSRPLGDTDFAEILRALGRHGVLHPVFLTHPITGRTVLYCNPGYAIRINGLDEAESDRVLAMLFAHQLQPKYLHTHRWTEGDVLVWDHIGTLHHAIPDYGPDERRLMKRCQVMADRIFDPEFLRAALG